MQIPLGKSKVEAFWNHQPDQPTKPPTTGRKTMHAEEVPHPRNNTADSSCQKAPWDNFIWNIEIGTQLQKWASA